MKFLFVLISVLVCTLSAQRKLAGEQDGVYDSAQYIVINDLIVPEGKTLEFLPGSALQFEPYVGINVFGHLKMKEVSLNASDSSANNTWNGINVAKKGRVSFENVSIRKSLFGITIPDSSSITRFERVTFIDNMKNMQINARSVNVEPNKPLTIDVNNKNVKPSRKDIGEIRNDREGVNLSDNMKIPFRWLSAAAALSCTALSVYCGVKTDQYSNKYESAENDSDVSRYVEKRRTYRNKSIASGIGAGVFGITLLFTLSL